MMKGIHGLGFRVYLVVVMEPFVALSPFALESSILFIQRYSDAGSNFKTISQGLKSVLP